MNECKLVVEHAKSNRSSCKSCKQKIEKDAIRLGVKSFRNDVEMVSWYIPSCYNPQRKTIDTLPVVEEVPGYDTLTPEGRTEFALEYQRILSGKRGSTVNPDGTPKKKSKLSSLPEDDATMTPVKSKYASMSVPALKAVLKANKQLVSGNKDELIDRCLDGELYGALPKCPRCESAVLRIDTNKPYVNGVGTLKCPGYWDADLGARMTCSFVSVNGEPEVKRPAWKEEATDDDEEAKAVPDYVANLTATMKDTAPKDAARKLFMTATEQKLGLPTDESKAIQEAGKFLLATKTDTGDWNADAAYKMLEKAYPKKKETASLVENEANKPFVEVFEEMVRLLRSNNGDGNKIIAYTKVATAVRSCPIALESCSQIKKLKKSADTKHLVNGIGDSAGKTIEEIIATGRSSKLEALQAEAADA